MEPILEGVTLSFPRPGERLLSAPPLDGENTGEVQRRHLQM